MNKTETRFIEYGYDNNETIKINMGPVHPSTHGVLRLMIELDGELVVRCQPIIGYLHSGKEKIACRATPGYSNTSILLIAPI